MWEERRQSGLAPGGVLMLPAQVILHLVGGNDSSGVPVSSFNTSRDLLTADGNGHYFGNNHVHARVISIVCAFRVCGGTSESVGLTSVRKSFIEWDSEMGEKGLAESKWWGSIVGKALFDLTDLFYQKQSAIEYYE